MLKYKKKNTLGQQERVSIFCQHGFTINNIIEQHGQNYYKVEGTDRLYVRIELLKV